MLLHLEQLGLVDYAAALELQREKVAQRKAGAIPDTLLLLEHPHVYTLGRNARQENMLVSAEFLASRGAQVFHTDRGGDVTYHGPGQLVGYPILDLTQHRRDISWYMRSLEEVFIRTARDFGIEAGRSPGAAGVWVGNDKLVAMGVHLSRWVTSHGFALNVNTDLQLFRVDRSLRPAGQGGDVPGQIARPARRNGRSHGAGGGALWGSFWIGNGRNGFSKRRTPYQPREEGVMVVVGDPLAAVFNR